jgi:hypothetical protein
MNDLVRLVVGFDARETIAYQVLANTLNGLDGADQLFESVVKPIK